MKRWQILPTQAAKRDQIAKGLGVSPILAQILVNRGVHNVAEGETFLSPDLKQLPNPFLLPDMEKAVARILEAIHRKESIAIFGDYDVDGITGTALLTLFFRSLNIFVETYIPERKEGYGLNPQAIDCFDSKGIRLIITVDCGTKSHEAIACAQKKRIDVIVTDHHDLPDSLPHCAALVNPKRQTGTENGKELAGVGVAFFLILALRMRLREEKKLPNPEPNLKRLLDLVALGTVADLVPLTGINRTLVFYGLQELAQTDKPGLKTLKLVSGVKRERLVTADIGFRLGPRINAGGRIAKPQLGLELLLTEDPTRARELAETLNQCNNDRQSLQKKQLREAIEQMGERPKTLGIVLESPDWHAGILGLIASKLVEQYYRPSIALTHEEENLKGSARSISGFNITQALEKCKDLLIQFGGHEAAAGLTLRKENLDSFKMKFEKILEETLDDDLLTPAIRIDSEIDLKEVTPDLVSELERLHPFGFGNPEPKFVVRNTDLRNLRIVGNNHLKLQISDGLIFLDGIAFGLGDHIDGEAQADIVCHPEWNTFQEDTRIQLKIKDLKRIDNG